MTMMKSLTFLMFPIAAAFVAADPNLQTHTSTAATTLWAGLASIAMELMVLSIFLLTWSATRYMVKKPEDPTPKSKSEVNSQGKTPLRLRSPNENAEAIILLCQEQFTRGLRLYRELVKHDLDKQIIEEDFYVALVESAVRVSKPDVAEQVVTRMHANGMKPSHAFLQSVMKLFAARKLFPECLRMWRMLSPGMAPHQVIFSCASVAACETGDTQLGREILAEAMKHFDVPSKEWLALMRHHARTRDWQTAVQDLRDLMAMAKPIDNIVFNTCLSACCLGEPLGCAIPTMRELIDELTAYEADHPMADNNRTVDIVSYNTVMKALARSGDVEQCFKLLEQFMARGLEPDDVSFSTLLDVCVDENEHHLASVALERMSSAGVKMNCVVMTTLMKGFIRSRRLDKAMQLYESMKATASSVKPDMITHSMLIKAHCDAQDIATALRVLEDMLESECTVDDVVFTHLIEGCCQVNNLRLAEKLFQDMRAADIMPSIYTINSMVKIYGKCGRPALALELVERMEEDYALKPTVVVLTCMLTGMLRQNHAKVPEAYDVFKRMSATLQPDTQLTQTMLLGLCGGKMWPEFVELAEKTLNAAPESGSKYVPNAAASWSTPAPRMSPYRISMNECFNNGLSAMLKDDKPSAPWAKKGPDGQASALALYTLMGKQNVEVTVPNVRSRLNLE